MQTLTFILPSLRQFSTLLALLILLPLSDGARAQTERSVQVIQFAKGKNEAKVTGTIAGRRFIDYQLRAAAGQTLSISLKSQHGSNSFNLLPPGSMDAAMAIGELSDHAFTGLLPDDGVYTIRVFLMRSAARRNESSRFDLHVAIEGQPLAALSPRTDAMVQGTRFHAVSTVTCQPAYSEHRECKAGVVRRGEDGTATVELSWPAEGQVRGMRRLLFVKGEPVASDTVQAIRQQRGEQGWLIQFDSDESYTVPYELVRGG